MADAWDFVVRKDDLREMDVLARAGAGPGAAGRRAGPVAVDHFSLTANNVTYGALGDQLSYWQFYPAPEPWGRIPAWGYAEVVASADPGIAPGESVFGYLPMSTHAVLQSGGVRNGGFADVSEQRSALPLVYNRYRIVRSDGDRDREQRTALFMPLYGTSWLLADWLIEQDFFGATRLVASAASSKTALGLGHALQRDFGSPISTVGLTSARHLEFTGSTGHWDSVRTYDELETLDDDTPTIYADFGGNADLRLRVHTHLGDALVASVSVGIADWESTTPPTGGHLPGPEPHFFFAPTRVEKRNADWGPAGLAHRLSTSQSRFVDRSHEWMTVQTGSGPDAIRDALLALMDGDVAPNVGIDITP